MAARAHRRAVGRCAYKNGVRGAAILAAVKSLRGQLLFFWVLLLAVCLALGGLMLGLFRQSAGAQIAEGTRSAEQACELIAARYAKSLAGPARPAPQIELLNVLLQLVLIETPRVEGGVWSRDGGFLAYAYPTYEGSSVKRDVPEAERGHIAELSAVAAHAQQRQTDIVRASREALIVSACPLAAPDRGLVAWTMTRTPTGLLDAQERLRQGLGVLLVAVLASGLWLGSILWRGWREVRRLEALLDDEAEASAQPLPATGIAELDRIVGALNRSRRRSAQMQAQLHASERQRARDQRLATLGRMTGGVAHEIRNPIAAMRLKAENALAAPEAARGAALQAILGQVERLDALVQRLLAVVQPLTLQPQAIAPGAWLRERVQGFEAQASAAGRRLVVSVDEAGPQPVLHADPLHLARAVDNLLDNAIRHARSEVRVGFEARAGEALIRVADDGPGVAEGLREQLFEPFATGRRDGTGLGLAMAREVALAHGGDLRLVATTGGACFELSLPWPDS